MIYVENLGDGDHLALRFGGRYFDLLHALVRSQSNRTFVGRDRTPRPYWRIPFNVLEDVRSDARALEPRIGEPVVVSLSTHAAAAYAQWEASIGRRLSLQAELDRPLDLGGQFLATRFPRYQQVGARFLYMNRRAICGDPTGYGKQNAVDTPILTPDGWRAIGELRPGDVVVGSDGGGTRVTGVYPQGVKPSYRVRFSDGSTVEAGPEHLWAMEYRCGGGSRKRRRRLVLTTEQIRTRPVIEQWWPNGRTTRMDLGKTILYLPMLSAPVQFAPQPQPPITPYLLGQLISHGLELTVFSRERRIPRAYLMLPPADRINLLQGLMDGDGTISSERNRVSYHTSSPGLAEDVVELVEGLGGVARVRTINRSNGDVEHSVGMRLPSWVEPFSLPRKRDRYRPGRCGRPCRTVTSVEYVRDVESVCIAVDAEDQLYATESCILTHNTAEALAATVMGVLADRYSKILLICEPALRRKMAAEVAKFVRWRVYVVEGDPRRRARAYHGFAQDVDPAYLVLPYTTCRSGIRAERDEGTGRRRVVADDAEVLGLLRLLDGQRACAIVDEAQNCKHWTSLQTRGVALLTDRCEHVYGLSATYLEGRLEELHTVFRVVRPNVFGSLHQFAARHINEGAWDEGGRYLRVDEVKRKVRPFVVRRREGEVDDEGALPSTVFLDRRLVLSDNQRALYRKVLDEEQTKREAWIEERGGSLPTDGLWRMNRERLACLFPELVDETVTENPKFDALLAIIQDAEQDAKFVVFSWFQRVVELLIERLDAHWPTVGLHGGMKVDRHAVWHRFQHDPEVRVLVCSDVWQRGQDLDAARHLVNYDVLWNPAHMVQRAGRIRRFTSRFHQVVVHTPIMERTVEQYILDEILEPKRALMTDVMDDGDEGPTITRATIRDVVRRYRG